MVLYVNNFVNALRAAKLKIHGQVQGVFYRMEAREKARELGLTGFVRNESDGAVFILAQGTRQDLEKFVKWCYNGPRGAKVDKIDIEWQNAADAHNEFEIHS